MWGLSKISAVFLAATSSSNKNNNNNNNNDNKIYKPKSQQDINQDFRALYSTLGEKAAVYKNHSPTIKFSFVTPPPRSTEGEEDKDWIDDDVFYSDAHIMHEKEEDKDIFSGVAKKHGSDKPLALYLPGLDGFGISAANWQFNDMSKTFELWRMSVAVDDRSSFGDLIKAVSGFVDEIAGSTSRPIYVIGESFGGLLAPAVTMQLLKREKRGGLTNPIEGLVMVNPATSFDESNWDVLGPALSTLGYLTEDRPIPFGLPSPYSVVGSLALSALVPSSEQLRKVVDTILNLETNTNPSSIADSIQGTLDSFKLTAEFLPPDLVAHRIQKWLMVGSSLVTPQRLEQLDVLTLVVVGQEDKMISSRQEAGRLTKLLPRCEKLEVPGAGHFVLDEGVNLTEAILYSKLDPMNFKETAKPFDPILDWKTPGKEQVEEIYDQVVKSLDDAFSPIFMSTDNDGKRYMGLNQIPREEGPLLFVSNHQLLGGDLGMLVGKLLKEDIVVRGLAHPIIFQNTTQRDELGGRTPGIQKRSTQGGGASPSASQFRTFGAVMVTPRNYYRLMQSGQNALLFPGGVREVFHGRDEAYQLFWPEKVDFVRTAARFNATIIPVSSVGMADSLNIVLDPSEVEALPFIGERAKEFAKNATSARFDTANEGENFLPPIVAPSLPSRNYFIFGKPLSTKDLNPKDKSSCATAYKSLQAEMNRGFDDILEARKKDPYMDAPARLAYERLTGRKAPTFTIEDVNR